MTLEKSYRAALEMVKKDCQKYGVRVKFSKGVQVVADGEAMSGYFDEATKTIAVAVGVEPFLAISLLLHEYNHMKQWAEEKRGVRTPGARAWRALKRVRGSKQVTMATLKVELDAERRTLKQLVRFGIGSKRQHLAYTRAAALYVMSHHVMHDKKPWFKRSVVISREANRVRHLLPTSLRQSFSKPPTGELYKFIESLLG